jgi:hypothetical protein
LVSHHMKPLEEDQVQTIGKFVDLTFKALVGIFPKHIGHCDMFCKLVALCDPTDSKGYIARVSGDLKPAHAVLTAACNYEGLGASLAERQDRDPQRIMIGHLQRALLAYATLQAEHKLANMDLPNITLQVITDGQIILNTVCDLQIGDDLKTLATDVDAAATLCRGGPDGKVWTYKLKDDASWEDVWAAAQKSILASSPKMFKEMAETIERGVAKVKETAVIFAMPPPDNIEHAMGVARSLRLTYAEGLMVAIFALPLDDSLAKKRKGDVHKVEKMLKDPLFQGIVFTTLDEHVQARASLGKELM